MHVYKNKTPGKKILNAGRPLIKSVYTNEQTVMLYIRNMDKAELLQNQLCLVLDQLKRKKDLYYKVDIFSSLNFQAARLGKKYPWVQTL